MNFATGSASNLLGGYLVGGGLMIFAALVEFAIGVDAERKPLEEVAPPLSQADPYDLATGSSLIAGRDRPI